VKTTGPRTSVQARPLHGAQRIEAATAEAEQLEREIVALVRALAPQLLDEPGAGPIVAADVIVAWSHRDRVGSEAAFARLAGVAPVPASSGKTVRHRLSRGGVNSTAPCTRSSFIAANTTRQRRLTSSDASPTARVAAKRRDYSSATSPATSIAYCNKRSR
jgi:transposase